MLAPAGNPDSLRAAVVNGADAVYLGAPMFSARAKAENFTFEQLAEAVRYCHLFGVKVYLAVNTVIKPEEYESALNTVKRALTTEIDAIIVQDLAFLSILHSTMPDIVVHLSTQAGVHNAAGAIIAEKLGAKRVILSREVLLEDIREIKRKTKLEIECFVHGALCVAFSGNCYFSSLATGLSGNRGKCLQFCRKKYSVEKREGYFLSAKDLNESDRINALIKAGVTSFKIEGRMRRAEYVGEATRHYKTLLSGSDDDVRDLNALFNRGNGCHAYLDNPTENVIYPNIQGHVGVKIGTVKSVNGKIATLKLDSPLKTGDGIKFIRNGIESGNASVSSDGYKTSFEGSVKVGDEVRITSDSELLKRINSRTKKIPINVDFSCKINEPAVVITTTENRQTVTVRSDFIVEKAKNAPITAETIKDCFNKTGDTEFVLSDFVCNLPSDAFIAKSTLNALRRKVYELLENEIIIDYEAKNKLNGVILRESSYNDDFNRKFELIKKILPNADFAGNNPKYTVNTENENIIFKSDDCNFLLAAADEYDAAIYFPRKYNETVASTIKNIESKTGKRVYLDLPIMIRGCDGDIINKILSDENVKNVIINNIGELELCKNKNYLLGSAMNVVNPDSPARKIISVEYDGKDFRGNYAYVFGKYPIMTFAHCPKKTLNGGKCLHCNHEPLMISDRSNEFDVIFYKAGYCYSQLLNCNPICAFDLCDKLKITRKIVDFIGIEPSLRNTVIDALRRNEKPVMMPITRGYFAKKLD